MYSLGITQIQDGFRWALLHVERKKITIERLEEGAAIPADVLSVRDLSIVTGLEGESVLRRDLTLPLSSRRLLRLSLPFQLEMLLPFPLDQSVVFPQYHPSGQETRITAWVTTKEFLQLHLNKWQSLGIDPDRVSYEPLALARWARFFFPEQPQLTLTIGNSAIALDHDQIICAMSSQDQDRLNLFLKQKYPLFEKIDQAPARDPWPSSALWHFAIPIGLALESFEKEACQLRSHGFKPARQKKREGRLLKLVLAAGLGAVIVTLGASKAIFYLQENSLKKQIGLDHIDGTLEQAASQMRQKNLKETKLSASSPLLPTAQEVLAWLSSLPTPVDIQHVDYQLISYPQEKQTSYQAQVTCEFQAESSSEADQFVKQLQQAPSFVEPTHELKWTSHPSGYQVSFPLQKG